MEGLYHDIINKELSDTFSSIDQLTLSYDGNRLKKVSDSASVLTYEGAMDFRDGAYKVTEYTWDANGRMASDANRGIYKIEYNELNLPREVKFNDGHVTRYTYAADGRKLRVTYLMTNSHVIDVLGPLGGAAAELNGGPVIEPQFPGDSLIAPIGSTRTLMTIDYSGNHIYRNDTLSLVLNDYGYLTADGLWLYHIKDWQGNVRVTIDQNGNVVEAVDYYPYGMVMEKGNEIATDAQPYKYGGKELDRRFGYDSYDFEARVYDPAVGRFTTPDPLAWDTPDVSPYVYCAGNPIRYVDPSGMILINTLSLEDNYKLSDARNYLGKEEFNGIMSTMKNSEIIYTLHEGNFKTFTHTMKNEEGKEIVYVDIYINTSKALVLDDNNIISPALAIYHEFGHALGVETNFDKYVDDVRTVDSQYENREEKRVVTTVENPKAIELGEPVRNNHKYRELKDVQDITYHKKNGIEFNHEY